MAETVTISTLGHGGDGIAEIDGTRLFVPFTLPGEVVEIERRGDRASLVRVIEPSPDRVTPRCRHFGICGNCILGHMAEPAYLAWKREQVVTAFAQRGIDVAVEPTVAVGPGSRRRAAFSAVRTNKGITLGFHRRHSNEIVATADCVVISPTIVAKVPLLREIAAVALPQKKIARVAVLAADNGLDIAITGAGKPAPKTLAALGRFGIDLDIARLTVEGVEVFRNRLPEIAAGPAMLFPPPGGFVQAARAAEEALARAVIEHVGDAAPVADLFAGIGTFTFRLAARAAVTAVEGEAALVAALDLAARKATGLKRVTALRRDLFVNPLAPPELAPFGAVVFDPPAAGARAQSEMLAASKVPRVAAVSCNPATLARDARILIDGGYTLERVLPVDQFLYSAEIEAVATFRR